MQGETAPDSSDDTLELSNLIGTLDGARSAFLRSSYDYFMERDPQLEKYLIKSKENLVRDFDICVQNILEDDETNPAVKETMVITLHSHEADQRAAYLNTLLGSDIYPRLKKDVDNETGSNDTDAPVFEPIKAYMGYGNAASYLQVLNDEVACFRDYLEDDLECFFDHIKSLEAAKYKQKDRKAPPKALLAFSGSAALGAAGVLITRKLRKPSR